MQVIGLYELNSVYYTDCIDTTLPPGLDSVLDVSFEAYNVRMISESNFVLNVTGLNQGCPNNCEQCLDSERCIRCSQGKVLSMYECLDICP